MIPTYACDGSAEFNRRLHEVMVRITADVEKTLGSNLVSLILGGGYGRGEGGVLTVDGNEMPYNDLDFTLVVRDKTKLPREEMDAISHRYADELKIHVDFSRPLTLQDIQVWPHWLMWYDLLNGHIVLKGASDILQRHAPFYLKKPLPLIEGTRLLLNRGAGMLWALRILRGAEDSSDADFVRRNYFKCALALGDALLMAYGRYTSVYHDRAEKFSALDKDIPAVANFHLVPLYDDALRFKFRPSEFPQDGFDEDLVKEILKLWGAVFLHIEQLRTGRRWPTLAAYTAWRGVREADQHTFIKLLRNIVRNRQVGQWSWLYPREQLYRELPELLGLTGGEIADWDARSAAFLKIWDRFN